MRNIRLILDKKAKSAEAGQKRIYPTISLMYEALDALAASHVSNPVFSLSCESERESEAAYAAACAASAVSSALNASSSTGNSHSRSAVPDGGEKAGGNFEGASSSAASSSSSSSSSSSFLQTMLKFCLLKDNRNNVAPSPFLLLLLPPLLYYVVDPQYRTLAFLTGIVLAINHIDTFLLGTPVARPDTHDTARLPTGRVVVRFAADLGKMLRYIDSKRDEVVKVSLTHLTVKAAGHVFHTSCQSLRGHVIGGRLYRQQSDAVDISVSADVSDIDTVAIKICNVQSKALEVIADELKFKGENLRRATAARRRGTSQVDREGSRRDQILSVLPASLADFCVFFLDFFGARYGASLPALGVVGYPLGICSVVTAPVSRPTDQAAGERHRAALHFVVVVCCYVLAVLCVCLFGFIFYRVF